MVTTTGSISPSCEAVWALNPLQKSMMFTPCWPSAGPTGGAGVAFPAGMCSLMYPVIFFISDLLHLQELELDGSRAPEDRHHHLESGSVFVHFLDLAREVGERAVHDPHG